MVESHSGEGRNLFELTEKTLLLHELDIANCISDSTDGASNMQGQKCNPYFKQPLLCPTIYRLLD